MTGAPRLILASSSPRRREVLSQLGLEFDVVAPPERVEKPWSGGLAAAAYARTTAEAKARAVAGAEKEALVVAADTVVVLDGEVLGKPASRGEARAMLARLSGRDHVVHTGLAVHGPDGRHAAGVEATRVEFRVLDETAIADYVATGEPLDKAGAYGIQGYGAALVASVHGCYFNVMGLPVTRLLELLGDVGWRYEFPGRLKSV